MLKEKVSDNDAAIEELAEQVIGTNDQTANLTKHMGEETPRDLAASKADGSATASQAVKIKAVGQLICSAIRSTEVHLANGSVVAVESSMVDVGIFLLEVHDSSGQSEIDHDRSQQNPDDNRDSKLCILAHKPYYILI